MLLEETSMPWAQQPVGEVRATICGRTQSCLGAFLFVTNSMWDGVRGLLKASQRKRELWSSRHPFELGHSNLYRRGLFRSSVFFFFRFKWFCQEIQRFVISDCSKDKVRQGQLSSNCLLLVLASLQLFERSALVSLASAWAQRLPVAQVCGEQRKCAAP